MPVFGLDESLLRSNSGALKRPPEARKTARPSAEKQRNRQIPRLDGRFSPTPCMGVIKFNQ